MARYIDLDDDEIIYCGNDGEYERYNIPTDAPTADVRENVRGEWFVSPDGRLKCSNCSKTPINEIRIRGNIVYDMIPINKLMKFCPNCGADMRKEVE